MDPSVFVVKTGQSEWTENMKSNFYIRPNENMMTIILIMSNYVSLPYLSPLSSAVHPDALVGLCEP